MRLNLIKFIISGAFALVNASTVQRSTVGRPFKRKAYSDNIRQSVKMKSVVPEPVEDVVR